MTTMVPRVLPAVIGAAILLSGCATPSGQEKVADFSAGSSQLKIAHLPSPTADGTPLFITVDGKEAGPLEVGSAMLLHVVPGEHQVAGYARSLVGQVTIPGVKVVTSTYKPRFVAYQVTQYQPPFTLKDSDPLPESAPIPAPIKSQSVAVPSPSIIELSSTDSEATPAAAGNAPGQAIPVPVSGTPAAQATPAPANGTPPTQTTPAPANGTPAAQATPSPANGTPSAQAAPAPANGTPPTQATPAPANGTPSAQATPAPANGTPSAQATPAPANGTPPAQVTPAPVNGTSPAQVTPVPASGTPPAQATPAPAATPAQSKPSPAPVTAPVTAPAPAVSSQPPRNPALPHVISAPAGSAGSESLEQ